ncbi:hypothetical protein NS220_07585 [Microbacterium testaceum]|uniref:Uncharacterized protein n=1 Tax=Microbacterium testaceum TaxID=2033 RepID=A0A147EXT7_MICTE|nr:hypothetical protein [Microbacterium testaceum]KTR94871.1 hypothetical protein NS220_07585 [Microbacterium testaceum]
MNTLTDPQAAPDDPQQTLYSAMTASSAVVWFSASAKASEALTHVAGLFGVSVYDLSIIDGALALTPERTVLMALTRSAKGIAACVAPIAQGGIEAIDAALAKDWQLTRDALARGDLGRNGIFLQHAVLMGGQLHPEFADSDALEYVNGADLVHFGSR